MFIFDIFLLQLSESLQQKSLHVKQNYFYCNWGLKKECCDKNSKGFHLNTVSICKRTLWWRWACAALKSPSRIFRTPLLQLYLHGSSRWRKTWSPVLNCCTTSTRLQSKKVRIPNGWSDSMAIAIFWLTVKLCVLGHFLGDVIYWSHVETETSVFSSLLISSYVILAKLTVTGSPRDLRSASHTFKWLVEHLNYYSTFSSTQVKLKVYFKSVQWFKLNHCTD